MQIAKGITNTKYKKLDLSNYHGSDWNIAIDVFRRRITERYIEPADLLIKAESSSGANEKKFGFTILAIDCLLCETLQSFYEGITDSTGKSKALFCRFLMERRHFRSYFKTREDAGRFYYDFRCGILHQAQSLGKTKVWAVGDLISKNGDFTIVNRLKFHSAVKHEIEIYINLLVSRNDLELLKNFKIKMDFIAQ